MHGNPQFIIYCGPMFSSKTSSLLMSLERFKYQNKRIAAFKPKIDNRFAMNEIVSHNGFRHPAMEITSGADILKLLADQNSADPEIIAVDEAFMIPGVAETLIWLYKSGFTVVVSSLDISAAGKVFSEVEKMLPWATRIKKCSAVCTVCGVDAHYTHKKVYTGEEIEVGGSEMYEPRCMTHHASINLSTL